MVVFDALDYFVFCHTLHFDSEFDAVERVSPSYAGLVTPAEPYAKVGADWFAYNDESEYDSNDGQTNEHNEERLCNFVHLQTVQISQFEIVVWIQSGGL